MESKCRNCPRQVSWFGRVIFAWLHCWLNKCKKVETTDLTEETGMAGEINRSDKKPLVELTPDEISAVWNSYINQANFFSGLEGGFNPIAFGKRISAQTNKKNEGF